MNAFEGSQPLTLGALRVDNTWSRVGLTPLQTLCLLESPPLKFCLDPNDDLCIQVGKSPAKSFTVCFRTLARSSPCWNNTLDGKFKKGKKPCPQDNCSEWTVELTEDDPKPMALLLSIFYSRFDLVPSYEFVVDIRYLYDIFVLTDKYDMTHVLRPWAGGWLRSTQRLSTWSGLSLREHCCHERLWILWELGDKVRFEKTARFLLLNSSTSTEDANSLRCDEVLEPPDIYEILKQTRLDTTEALLTPLNPIQ
ncbi:hypothetical protein HD806DRAFT_116027 [Xylariaceae sp. AK1471]|nr:hypothetical protein HD806DRAFT_116027 [Xylariaceae sp. AK1471]